MWTSDSQTWPPLLQRALTQQISIDIVILRPRPVEADDVAVAIGLLFALPAIRTSMPDAPPMGGPLDACGSIWNLAFVLIASLLLMAAWLGNIEED